MGAEKLGTAIRRRQIAEAALSIVARDGMSGLSMSGLAGHVGLVTSAIYRHFNNKDEVLGAVLDLLSERFKANIQSVRQEAEAPEEQLKLLFALHLQLIQEVNAVPRVLFSDEVYGSNSQRKSKLYGIIRAYLSEIAAIVREGQAREHFLPDLDPGTISVMFLGLIQPAVILWHLSDGKFDPRHQMESAWPVFRRAIRGF
jgi:TetR/AcrR family transcriptional regulator, fatty acid metabolism regulator protein